MKIVGFIPESFVDFPGKICSTLFVSGCNLSCPWCINPDLVLNRIQKNYKLDYILKRIHSLNNSFSMINSITITGGECTLYPDLPELCQALKKEGYKVKVDTNGTNPMMLIELIFTGLVDYIAMDVKHLPSQYEKVVGRNLTPLERFNIVESILLLKENLVPYEFRTTVIPGVHTVEVIKEMSEFLKDSELWYLQNFFSGKKYLDSKYESIKPFSSEEMQSFINIGKKNIKSMRIRSL